MNNNLAYFVYTLIFMFLTPFLNMVLLGAVGVSVAYTTVMIGSWVVGSVISYGVATGIKAAAQMNND